jgi:hypothetical protein
VTTDGPTDGQTDGQPLTPEQEATVSELLAGAGGHVGMPAEVVARLDTVLAELQHERGERDGADVVELRSRRRWPQLLLAAAAVVVGGYAVGTVATQGTLTGADGGDAASDSSASQGDTFIAEGSKELDDLQDTDDQSAGDGAGSAESKPAPSQSSGRGLMRTTVRLSSDRLEVGVLRALRVLEAQPRAGLTSGYSADSTCRTPELARRERALEVRYDGTLAVLVIGPEQSGPEQSGTEQTGTVEATVYSCSGDELDSTVVRP